MPLRKKAVPIPDTTNILQVYDPVSDSWTIGPSLNQVRSFPAGTDVANTAVAVGGYDGSTTITSVEINVTSGGGLQSYADARTALLATPTYSDSDGNGTFSDSDLYSNGDGDGDGCYFSNSDRYSDGDGDGNGNRDPHAAAYPNAETGSDTAVSPDDHAIALAAADATLIGIIQAGTREQNLTSSPSMTG